MQATEPLKKTPLYSRHTALNGKMVDFGGWLLPIQYTGILAEHLWTRKSCSFFDVSHLGEFRVVGAGSFDFLQARLTNDLGKMSDGSMLYSLLCDEKGLTIDDILIYRQTAEDYYLIVNAANISRDFEALSQYAPAGVSLKDQSDETACIAVQGPRAEAVLEKLFKFSLQNLAYYRFKEERFMNEPVWVSRSGYTGEDGFEIFSSNKLAPFLWDALAGGGKDEGALPAGLGARNTLRLEAGNALYGHEIDPTTTPLEAGLGWAVSFDKGRFVGRDSLMKLKEKGPSRKLVGFKMLDKSIARDHYPIFKDGQKTGEVTSGSFGPSVGSGIGLGYVRKEHATTGAKIEVHVHERRAPAEIVQRPFVPLNHKKIKDSKS